MEIIILNHEQLNRGVSYLNYSNPHLLIMINEKENLSYKPTPYCKDILELEFDDVENIDSNHTYFNQDDAKNILEAVNKNASQISAIVVCSKQGLSRSVAIGAALSKILNLVDDPVFTQGVPNMLVYLTILECFFSDPKYSTNYNSIDYIRRVSSRRILTPGNYRELEYRSDCRKEE